MAPRTGRPPLENPRDKGYRIRMTREEETRLDYCCKVLGLTKADVIRQGIDAMYEKALKTKRE